MIGFQRFLSCLFLIGIRSQSQVSYYLKGIDNSYDWYILVVSYFRALQSISQNNVHSVPLEERFELGRVIN